MFNGIRDAKHNVFHTIYDNKPKLIQDLNEAKNYFIDNIKNANINKSFNTDRIKSDANDLVNSYIYDSALLLELLNTVRDTYVKYNVSDGVATIDLYLFLLSYNDHRNKFTKYIDFISQSYNDNIDINDLDINNIIQKDINKITDVINNLPSDSVLNNIKQDILAEINDKWVNTTPDIVMWVIAALMKVY